MIDALRARWRGDGGYRDVLSISIPLVLSTSSWTIQHFVDRMFLAWYSPDAAAASMAGGMLYFCLFAIFFGTAGYVNTFVAQYTGARHDERVGPAVWQGFYFCLLAVIPMVILVPSAGWIFDFIGHDPRVAELEKPYFRILCYGGFFNVWAAGASCFYTGRGKTWTVMWVNIASNALNIVLDYLLIFGRFGFPEMGIEGAAWATVAAVFLNMILFTFLLLQKKYRTQYAMLSGWRLDRDLFRRLMCYGLPSGVQFVLDVFSWVLFTMLIGRIGREELAITSIAFNINTLSFMPMVGFGVAVSTLVGQYLGKNRPEQAERATWSAFHLCFIYMASFSVLYFALPGVFLYPFEVNSDPETFRVLRPMGVIILRFIAFYCLFDTMNVIFSGALKGAGDTRFVLYATVGLGWLLMVIPIIVFCVVLGSGLYAAWGFATLFVSVLGVVFWVRVVGGRWKSMRVIEQEAIIPMVPTQESTPTEVG